MPVNMHEEYDYIPEQMEPKYEKYEYCTVSNAPMDQQLGLFTVFRRLNQSIDQSELVDKVAQINLFCEKT